MKITTGSILILVAVVLFALAAFNADVFSLSQVRLLAFGLAFFAAGHLV